MNTIQVPPPNKYGDVSPCLAIAREFGVDWSVPLYVVDAMVYGRQPPQDTIVLSAVPKNLWDACALVADRTIAQRLVAEQSTIWFQDGVWYSA